MNSWLVRKRVVWFSKLLFSLSVMIGMASCSTFQKNLENPTILTKKNVSVLNGKYDVIAIQDDSITQHNERSIYYHNNLISELDRKLLRDTLRFDSINTYSIELEMKSPKLMQIKYLEEGKIYRTRAIKTKVTRDGYVLLKNKNVGFVLVPFICGAIDINRTRISIDTQGDLIFDVSNTRAGAALLVVFLDSRNVKHRCSYERLSALATSSK